MVNFRIVTNLMMFCIVFSSLFGANAYSAGREVPLWNSLSEFDAVVVGTVDSTQSIEAKEVTNGPQFDAIVVLRLDEVITGDIGKRGDLCQIRIGSPVSAVATANRVVDGYKKGDRDIWFLKKVEGGNRLIAIFRNRPDIPDHWEEYLTVFRNGAKTSQSGLVCIASLRLNPVLSKVASRFKRPSFCTRTNGLQNFLIILIGNHLYAYFCQMYMEWTKGLRSACTTWVTCLRKM